MVINRISDSLLTPSLQLHRQYISLYSHHSKYLTLNIQKATCLTITVKGNDLIGTLNNLH